MAEEKQNFADVGTESFDIGVKGKKEPVVLNIEEEKGGGVILDKEKARAIEGTGNPLKDFWNRINRYFIEHSKVKIVDKANFFHLLSVMINAGIPMVKALKSLQMQMDKSPRMKIIVTNMAEDIEGGESLSESMSFYNDVFSEQEIGMVESGEASGQLSNVLANLAKDTEKAYQIRSKVKGAMTYPIIIVVLLIGVVVVMMTVVVPKLTSLFAAAGSDLPLITRIVVGTSDYMISHKTIMLLSVAIFALFFMLFKKTDVGKYAIDKFKISVPIFGPLFRKAFLSRFARSLSNLLDSRVSIVRTMEIVAESIGNEVFRKRLLLGAEDIKQGIPLAENMTHSDLFPPMLVSMVDVGEKTAQLDEIMAKVADFYEQEVDNSVATISKVIEPVILVVIGATVGVIVAAVMLPIMKLSNLSGAM